MSDIADGGKGRLMSNPEDTENLTDATIEAEGDEANAEHEADRAPTPDEEAAAPTEVDKSVAEHYDEANKTGANVKGEGAI